MAQTAANVSYAKPAVGGAAYVAPLGTTLPTDAKTALATAYKALGYISQDGLRNEPTIDSDMIKAWGGDVVLNLDKGKTDLYKFKLIEMLNENVLKAVYGKDNVTGTIDSMITIKSNNAEQEALIWVFDMILKGGILKRVIIPNGTITDIGEIAYIDSDAVGYELTVSAAVDASGNTHTEFIEKPASGGGGGT
jgi:hypothetical protein